MMLEHEAPEDAVHHHGVQHAHRFSRLPIVSSSQGSPDPRRLPFGSGSSPYPKGSRRGSGELVNRDDRETREPMGMLDTVMVNGVSSFVLEHRALHAQQRHHLQRHGREPADELIILSAADTTDRYWCRSR